MAGCFPRNRARFLPLRSQKLCCRSHHIVRRSRLSCIACLRAAKCSFPRGTFGTRCTRTLFGSTTQCAADARRSGGAYRRIGRVLHHSACLFRLGQLASSSHRSCAVTSFVADAHVFLSQHICASAASASPGARPTAAQPNHYDRADRLPAPPHRSAPLG